jgi:tetratricopeptide (TPR) repeat protein
MKRVRLLTMMLGILSLVWGFVAIQSARADYSQELMQTGRRCFEQGRYSEAEEYFRVASESPASSAEAHYWYANALAKRFKGSQAMAEYNVCLRLNPQPLVAEYCRKALAGYGVVRSNALLPVQTAAAANVVMPNVVPTNFGSPLSPAPKERRKVAQAARRVAEQSVDAVDRLRDAGDSSLAIKDTDTYMRLAKVDAHAHCAGASFTNGTTGAIPLNDAARYYGRLENNILDHAALDSMQTALSNEQREQGLQISARNLQDLLGSPPTQASTVIIQPLGTNLYVRNYQTFGN